MGLAGISGWAALPWMFDISPAQTTYDTIIIKIIVGRILWLLTVFQSVRHIGQPHIMRFLHQVYKSTDAGFDSATIPVEEFFGSTSTSFPAVGEILPIRP